MLALALSPLTGHEIEIEIAIAVIRGSVDVVGVWFMRFSLDADRATAEALPGYQSQDGEHAGACDSANVATAGGPGYSVTSVTVSGSTRDFCTTG